MDCLFCKIISGEIVSKKVYEDEKVMVIMDINPVCDGHMLVLPKKHFDTVFDVDSEYLHYLIEIGKKMSTLIMEKLGYKGTTLLFNYGDKQAIKHVHLHVIGDINATKKEDVDTIYQKLIG